MVSVADAQPTGTIVDPWEEAPPAEATPVEPAPPVEAPPPTAAPPSLPKRWEAPPENPDFLPGMPPPDPVVQAKAAEPEPSGPRRLPYEVVDRPVILPGGLTELSATVGHQKLTVTSDRFGPSGSTREGRLLLDFDLEHSFGPINIGVGLGLLAYAWLAIDTGTFPRVVQLYLGTSIAQPDERYFRHQTLSVAHKFHLVPKRFAVVAWVDAASNQSGTVMFGRLDERQTLTASISATVQIQLEERTCMFLGAAAGAPFFESRPSDADVSISARLGFVFAMHSWDLGTTLMLGDIGGVDSLTVLGWLQKRWGL